MNPPRLRQSGMTEQIFDTLPDCVAAGYTHIPVCLSLPADLETPLSVYCKLANTKNTYLFESVQGGEKWGRYSIIGTACREWISVCGNTISHHRNSTVTNHVHSNPLTWIEQWHQQYKYKKPESESLSRFSGGLVGYFGYETVAMIEDRLKCPAKKAETPDIMLMRSDELVVFDNLKGEMHLIVHAEPNELSVRKAQRRIEGWRDKLAISCVPEPYAGAPPDASKVTYEFPQPDFMQAVETIRDHIVRGDVMQVVLSQRMRLPFSVPPINLYRAIRNINPSPYMFFLRCGHVDIVGASPEVLVRVENGEICVRPIAGTRPRGKNQAEDKRLADELLTDPKELAEHLMLIDLGRNDIGRVSEMGTVKVTEQMIIERYSHVMHIVSNVSGSLRRSLSAMDALRATFPAGTVSGAPKVRAMEIIRALEPVSRGIYAGAVGYIGWQGNLDTAIAIRTAVVRDETLFVHSGAGIVADSVADNEWQETMNKAGAMLHAATMAAQY